MKVLAAWNRCLAILLVLFLSQASFAAQKPNIVFVLTDDQTLDDQEVMKRTNELLGAQGITFLNAYVTDPLCCPSRTSILTGLYAHNHKVFGNEGPKGGEPGFIRFGHEESNLALWLKAAGYTTFLGGKYLNAYPGPPRIPPGWDVWEGIATPPYPSSDHTDDLSGQTVHFIHTAAEPFFAYVAAIPPHNPHIPTERHKKLLLDRPFKKRGSFDEEDMRDKSWRNAGLPRIGAQTKEGIEVVQRERLQSLLSVDEMVERIVTALTQTGRLQNTYIVFTSDNGWFYGEHRYDVGKGAPYEEAVHVPLLIRGPGVPKGKTLDHLVSLVDIAPTFLEFAQGASPEPLDGKSWVPLLGPQAPPESDWRKAVYFEDDSWKGIRTKRYTYFEWSDSFPELYDLQTDPWQMENLMHWYGELPENRPLALRGMQLPPEMSLIKQEFERLSTCSGISCH